MRIFYKIQQFFLNIKRVIVYIPTIWNDRDYDYVFIYRLLQFKLSMVRKRYENNDFFVGQDDAVKHLAECDTILERLLNDNYVENEYDQFEEKWGEVIINKTFKRANVLTEEDKKQEREDVINLSKLEDDRKNNDKKRLFEILNDNIEKWWD
mgnify:FL=1